MLTSIKKDDKLVFVNITNIPFSSKKKASIYVCNKRMIDALPQSFFGIREMLLCIKSIDKFKWICADNNTIENKIKEFINEL